MSDLPEHPTEEVISAMASAISDELEDGLSSYSAAARAAYRVVFSHEEHVPGAGGGEDA